MSRRAIAADDVIIWQAEPRKTQLYVDSTRVTISITLYDKGDEREFIEMFVSASNRHLDLNTGTVIGKVTPLIKLMSECLFKDLRRELPDNRSSDKQKLLILKAMQTLI